MIRVTGLKVIAFVLKALLYLVVLEVVSWFFDNIDIVELMVLSCFVVLIYICMYIYFRIIRRVDHFLVIFLFNDVCMYLVFEVLFVVLSWYAYMISWAFMCSLNSH